MLRYTDELDNRNFACVKFRHDTFKLKNNKGADQTVRMRRLVWAFVVRKHRRQRFSSQEPYIVKLLFLTLTLSHKGKESVSRYAQLP